MCGMTLALRLAEGGHRVTLFEASDRLGGLADAWQVGELRWDRHYHVTLLSDQNTGRLIGELGLAEEMNWRVTRTGYFSGDRLASMSNSWEYLRLPGLSLLQKMRLAWTIVYASRVTDWRSLEKISVEDWLTQLSGRAVFERLWRPLLRAKLGDRYAECSAAFLWATIKRLYAARESGLKTEKFGYVAGGYGHMVDTFSARLQELGVEIRLSSAVTNLAAENAAAASQGATWKIETAASGLESFDRVVNTVTPAVAAKMCSNLPAEESARLQAVPFQGLLCASLVLEKPLADFYLTYLMAEDLPFTAVVEMSSMVDSAELSGKYLIYLPLYLSAADPRFQQSDEEIRASFLAGLKRIYPSFKESHVLAFRVSRVAEVFPLPVLDFSNKQPPASSALPGLHFVNAAHIVNGTLNVNETVGLAERVAASLLNSDGLESGLVTSGLPTSSSHNSEVSA